MFQYANTGQQNAPAVTRTLFDGHFYVEVLRLSFSNQDLDDFKS